MAERPGAAGPLKFLYPGWFAIVMGLAGLSLAWHRAAPLMGEMATGVALVVAALAVGVFAVLLAATAWRWRAHPEAWAEDRRHPVRHTFIATLPISMMVLATAGVSLLGPSGPVEALWWLGALSQLAVTWWVLSRWWRPGTGGLPWASVTPALLMPVVGNVLAPLAGVPLGHADWSAAQFGIGLLFWPVIVVLLGVRIASHGMLPERLLPTLFILLAPPALVGSCLLQFGAPMALAWGCWGIAAFCFAWVAGTAPRLRQLAFSIPHWGMSFPLTAFAALTLRLAAPGSVLAVGAMALLALASLVILGLMAGTFRGLRDGSLLAPEPVAAIAVAAASAHPGAGGTGPAHAG
ncbi:MAG: SLAC1 anion channel family protein [Burkholderiaceae bacterium]